MNSTPKKSNTEGFLFVNPLIKKLSKIQETDGTEASYRGIFRKCLYFLAMICAGVAFALILHAMTFDASSEFGFSSTMIISIFVSLGMFLIFPFLAFFIRRTIPVTGALYCVSVGNVLASMVLLDNEFGGYVLLALVLTVAIVTVLAAMYSSGFVKVTQKFRTIMYTLFFTSFLGGILMLICYFIPGLRDMVLALQNNLFISIGVGIIGIIIACLFLLVDFDTIQQTVERKLPKKYEWYAAFSVVFTVVWLYFKILDLISKVKNN